MTPADLDELVARTADEAWAEYIPGAFHQVIAALREAWKRIDAVEIVKANYDEALAEWKAAEAKVERYRVALEAIQNAYGSPEDEDFVTSTAREALAGEKDESRGSSSQTSAEGEGKSGVARWTLGEEEL
jgi:hypothetical protein